MMTKLAHMRENRKNNKGFSLVELIIVIAIMVALIAVMGPQYVKYVQSSRDAVVSDAAESVLSVAKSEYAMNYLRKTGETGTITIAADSSGNSPVTVTFGTGVEYYKDGGATNGGAAAFTEVCGLDTSKKVKSSKSYTITIAGTATAPVITMEEN